jgi:hypothetical protein
MELGHSFWYKMVQITLLIAQYFVFLRITSINKNLILPFHKSLGNGERESEGESRKLN